MRAKHIRGHNPVQILPQPNKTDLRHCPQGEGPVLICPYRGKSCVDRCLRLITVMVWVIFGFTKFIGVVFNSRTKKINVGGSMVGGYI